MLNEDYRDMLRILSEEKIADLITNKKSTGRTRDLADVEALQAIRDAQKDI